MSELGRAFARYRKFYDAIITLGCDPQFTGSEWSLRCPGHDDQRHSFTVRITPDRLLIWCHAGCELKDILEHLDLQESDLFPDKSSHDTKRCISAIYDYLNESGTLLYQSVRYKPKDFGQRRPDPNKPGKYIYNLNGVRLVLYSLPEVLAAIARGETIYIVEGEKDAESVRSIGLTATCNPLGAGKWREDYSEMLCGARIVLMPDNDDPGRKHCDLVGRSLQGIAAEVRVLALPSLPDKGDFSDWLEAGGTREQLEKLTSEVPEWTPSDSIQPEAEPHGRKQQSKLRTESATEKAVSKALELLNTDIRLFLNERWEVFARCLKNGHWENHPIRSRNFKNYLRSKLYKDENVVLRDSLLDLILDTFTADCHTEDLYQTPIRVTGDFQSSHYDLCDSDWNTVKIDAGGWNVGADEHSLFRRFDGMQAQPMPIHGGNLNLLKPYLSLPDDENDNFWRLIVSVLVACFFSNIEHPILIFWGEHGSAKSTRAEILGTLIDPHLAALSAPPRDQAEWIQSASHRYLMVLDNVGRLTEWLQNSLCRCVTGEGFQKRKLYSDEDDVIFVFRCCIILTGINAANQAPDVLDRAITVGPLQKFENNKSKSELMEEFQKDRPAILGALLDAVSGVMRVLPAVTVPNAPRLADFARIGVALERVLNWPEGSFLKDYRSNIQASDEDAIDSSSLGTALKDYITVNKLSDLKTTASKLLNTLESTTGSRLIHNRDWPNSAKALKAELMRLAPNLRAVGISVSEHRTNKGRFIHFRHVEVKREAS